MSVVGMWLGLCTSATAALAIVLGAGWVLRVRSIVHEQRLFRAAAFAAGILLAAVALDFLPETWEKSGSYAPWGMFVGILVLWSIAQWADRRFTVQVPEQDTDASGQTGALQANLTVAGAMTIAVALSVHSLFEGAALAAAVTQVDSSSLLFAMSMVLHKLPEGVLWGLAILRAFPDIRQRWLGAMLLIPALACLAGTGLGIAIATTADSLWMNGIGTVMAGALLYVCLAELVPALREYQTVPGVHRWYLAGVAAMAGIIGISTVLGA